MKDGRFVGKNCLVTGGGSGIGYATAQKFAESGARVFIVGRNGARLAKAAEKLHGETGAEVIAVAGDMSDEKEIERVVAEVGRQAGAIHVLANCAGRSVSSMLLDLSAEDWDAILGINLRAVFLLSRCVAKNMIAHKVPHGKIISVSSISSRMGEFGNGAYSVSKGALNTLTQVMGLEFAQYGISVTAVCPGYVDTEMLREVFETRGPLEGMTAQEYQDYLVGSVPMKRMADPAEIGGFIRFLATDEANYITGVALTMAGGKMLI
ncbi:SDR family oxidoreductase [Intestinibacillus massiliensis]|nr:SDR family oxidoreductase [Intestinibacillus massiliensis]